MPDFNNEKLLDALALKDNEDINLIKSKIEKTYNTFNKIKSNNNKL